MNISTAISLIEAEWEQPFGFLARLRTGQFDPEGYERLMNTLRSVRLEDSHYLERRFVAVTWSIPLYVYWQMAFVQEKSGQGKETEQAYYELLHLLDDLLGIP